MASAHASRRIAQVRPDSSCGYFIVYSANSPTSLSALGDRLRRLLADIERRQTTVLRQAQDADADDPFTTALRQTYNDLERQKNDTTAALADLGAAPAEARQPATDAALLEALPALRLDLSHAPEHLLRRLFEVTRLTVRTHHGTDSADS